MQEFPKNSRSSDIAFRHIIAWGSKCLINKWDGDRCMWAGAVYVSAMLKSWTFYDHIAEQHKRPQEQKHIKDWFKM